MRSLHKECHTGNAISSEANNRITPDISVVSGQGERQLGSCSISAQCNEDLIPCIFSWMNYWYTEEGAMAGSYGVEGMDYEVNADGSIRQPLTVTMTDSSKCSTTGPALRNRAGCTILGMRTESHSAGENPAARPG